MKVITLCGSLRVGRKLWDEIGKKLALDGWCVLTVVVWDMYDELHSTHKDLKKKLDDEHLQKILMSNAIFVINKDGYIGESTKREIEYAKKLNLHIYYLEDLRGVEK